MPKVKLKQLDQSGASDRQLALFDSTSGNWQGGYLKGLWRPCLVTTTVDVTLSGGAPNTLDGVTLAVNDRILVKDQTAQTENGVYIVQTLGTGANGTWVRSTDGDGNEDFSGGKLVAISEGTTRANSLWQLESDDPITIGSTAIVFGEKGAAGAGSTINVQDEGVNVVNTPHSTLNFVGSGVVASDATGGVAQVTINPEDENFVIASRAFS